MAMRARTVFVISALLVAAVLPFLCNREDREFDAAERDRFAVRGGTFATLAKGVTHYELSGMVGAPLVVLVHGTSGPMGVWDETVPALVAAGYRALRYDLYGRGASARLEVDHDLDLYVGQLEQLIAQVADQPAVVVGSSLGAIVATELSLRRPERVRGLVLIGPAGFPLEATWMAKISQAPLIGDYLMQVVGDRQLVEHQRKYFVVPERFESQHQNFAEQLRYRGTKAAILSTLRHAPLQAYLDGYERLGQSKLPVLVIWGEQDGTFPITHRSELEPRLPQAEFVTAPNAGHLPQLEAATLVNSRLLSFLATFGQNPG
jgi:pimeloyl-ACP methyl ester carboxylesterase